MMMVSGALSGMRAIGCSVILVSLPVHVTATFFREMIGHKDDQGVEFESLIASWMTMLRLVCRDCKVLVDRFSFYTTCNG